MRSMVLLPLISVLLLPTTVQVVASTRGEGGCIVGCNADVAQRRTTRVSGKVAGVLNGLNETQPAAASITPVGMSMWRGPKASWLWNRTGCHGLRTCCTIDSCDPVFSEAARLASLGLRQQYILEGIHYGVGGCEWHSFHDSPHNCSLPGGPTDPNMDDWEYSVRAAVLGALRAGITAPYFDVWNEPNALDKVTCMASHTPPCTYDANLTQDAFLAIYDRAQRTVKKTSTAALVVAPSLSDGGPGNFGFTRTIFPWLQAFLKHTHAQNTLPDVLSWHVSMVGANASELEGHHATLKAWAKSEGIPLPPIGHNEVIGPSESLSPAANLAFLSTLERLEVEHSCRACWTDDVTKQSPCNDNTLDSLLTNDCLANHSLGPNKGYRPTCEPALKPRSNWWVFKMVWELTGQEMLPKLEVDGIAAASSANDGVNLTVLLGHSASSTPLPPPPQDLSVEFTALPANAKLTVEVTHVATSGRNEAPAELHATSMEATVTASGELKVPVRQTVDGAVYRVRLLSAEV